MSRTNARLIEVDTQDILFFRTSRPRKMTTDQIVERLSQISTIGKAPREELLWIASHGSLRRFEPGEIVSHRDRPVEGMYILFSGRISIRVDRGSGQEKVMEWHAGDATGLLPYSRLRNPPGDTVVEEPTEALELVKSELPGLIRNCYEVTAILVHVMMDRARQFTSADLRNEKLTSLGKLAAGLAHELNNPASAVLRDAKSLPGILTAAEEAARSLGSAGLTSEQLDLLDHVHTICVDGGSHRVISGLALADREEEIEEWLDSHDADAGFAEDLARTPVTLAALDKLSDAFQASELEVALRWIAAGCAAKSLAVDIERAASRIHSLVSAVKGFTHMDHDPSVGPVDIPAGLNDTVALLTGKARSKSVGISLELASSLPVIHGLSAEINQIWMNLLDNAIDAAPVNGQITVTARHEQECVVVRVADNGKGIPPEIKGKIFDPFFTTKPVGEGTGLGLDIVRKIVDWHKGKIEVESEPGRTEFRVKLPVK
jgi:signal transduction histidine kinase